MSAEIATICTEHYQNLMDLPNVIGVGMGYKVVNGMPTNSLCVATFVSKKISRDRLTEEAMIPKSYNGIATDVIEMSEIHARSLKDKVMPVSPGYSVGIVKVSSLVTAGTCGCLVCDKQNPDIRYILGSNHVFVGNNEEAIGTDILQPAKVDGLLAARKIATLSKYIPIGFKTPTEFPINYVDCAIAKLIAKDMVTPEIAYIGVPTGTEEAVAGMPVVKTGRASGFSNGIIQYTHATVDVIYGPNKVATFTNQIITTAMTKDGDSGAVLVNPSNNKILGLLVSGGDDGCIFSPIDEVLKALDVDLVMDN